MGMFDFKRKTPQEAAPLSPTLVSKEDIYHAELNVLIMRKGMAVPLEAIPSLLRFGAKPNQFHLTQEQPEELDALRAGEFDTRLSAYFANPQIADKAFLKEDADRSVGLSVAKAHRVAVFAAQPRLLTRMTTCVQACGVPAQQIHPVMVLDAMAYAAEKYRPTCVLMAFQPETGAEQLQCLQALKRLHGVETVCLAVDVPEEKLHDELWRIQLRQKFKAFGVAVLFSPLNRFDIAELLGVSVRPGAEKSTDYQTNPEKVVS